MAEEPLVPRSIVTRSVAGGFVALTLLGGGAAYAGARLVWWAGEQIGQHLPTSLPDVSGATDQLLQGSNPFDQAADAARSQAGELLQGAKDAAVDAAQEEVRSQVEAVVGSPDTQILQNLL